MKSGIFALILLGYVGIPVYAGQLVVKETDTVIIIEYNGDASDKDGMKSLEEQPAFKQLALMSGRTPAVADATNTKEHGRDKVMDEKWKQFAADKKQREAAQSRHKVPGQTSSGRHGQSADEELSINQ